jgi:hypothetical protein
VRRPLSGSWPRWSWRPDRGRLRILTFALAMITIVYAGSVPRQW